MRVRIVILDVVHAELGGESGHIAVGRSWVGSKHGVVSSFVVLLGSSGAVAENAAVLGR